jgi:hypothetical protein
VDQWEEVVDQSEEVVDQREEVVEAGEEGEEGSSHCIILLYPQSGVEVSWDS